MKRVSLFLLAFLIVSLVLSMYQISEVKANPDETFGKTSIGGQNYGGADDRLYLDQATLTEDGTVIKISLYGKLSSSGSVHMMTAIYDDDSGEPGDLMGYSNEISVTTTLQWWNFTCDIELTAGNYWLGWNQEADPVFTYYYDSGNARYENNVEYDDGFPSSAPSMSSTSKDFSIFATYTTAGVQEYSEEFTETVSVSASSHFWRALLYKNIEGITTTATTYTWGEYPCFFSETITTTEEQNEWNELRRFFTETVTIREELVKQLALFRLFTETIGITETSSFATEILVEITEFAETVSIDASLYLWKAKQFMIEEGVIGVADFYKWISLRQFFTETINPTETLQLLREKLLSVTETINTSAFLQALKETLVTIIEFTDIIPFTATMYLTPQKIVPPIEVTTFGTVAFVIAIIALAIAVTAITAKKS